MPMSVYWSVSFAFFIWAGCIVSFIIANSNLWYRGQD